MSNRAPGKGAYKVGYGKPPKDRQFKPGVSGNPKGRSKKVFIMSEAVSNILTAKLLVTVNGETKLMTNLEAAIWGTVKKAISGDTRALQMCIGLGERSAYDEKSKEVHPQLQGLFDALKAGPVESK